MSRLFASSVLIVVLAACGGSSVAVGKTDTSGQTLQTKKDGSPTGDGKTCSWANTSVYDSIGASATTPVPTYSLGDEFKSIDGCNECTCAAKGIMCTVKSCGQPRACDADAKLCPDGTGVGRSGPSCTFAPCPGEVVCTADAKKCPDGSYVSRTGANCTFAACGGDPGGGNVACPDLAKQCPDGSYVGASGPNCDFVCPTTTCADIEQAAGKQLTEMASRYTACTQASDCIDVPIAADCVDQCARSINISGKVDFANAQAGVNSTMCEQYKAQGCSLIHPACAPSPTPSCVNKVCQ